MKWLWDRILGRKPRSKETVDEHVDAELETPERPRSHVAFLVHDAVGPAAYRLHRFDDAASAAEFVQLWFLPGLEHGTLAFWASEAEPVRQEDSNDGRPAEVVVLVRDEARPGVVYPFSFSNMALARSWLTRETAKDPDISSAQVLWALPVQISRDHWGRARLSPAEPPALRRPEPAPVTTPAEPTRAADRPEETPSERSAATAGRAEERRAGEARNIETAEENAEILREVDRVFRERRQEQREGPFEGFDSPPGKF